MRTATFLFALFAVTAACATPSLAKAVPKAPFVVEAGEVQLQPLVDRAAAYLGRNILLSDQEVANTGHTLAPVQLQQRIETDRDGCEELLTSLLHRAGFALVQLDGGTMFEFVAMNGIRGREVLQRAQPRTVDEVLARPNLKIPVTVTMPLEHVNAAIATNALRPFFASTGAPTGAGMTIGNVGQANAMLLSGLQDQVVQAIRVVREVDQPAAKPSDSGLDRTLADLQRRLRAVEDKLARLAPEDASK